MKNNPEPQGQTETAPGVGSGEIVLPTAREDVKDIISALLFVVGIILLGDFDWRIGVGTLCVWSHQHRVNRQLTSRQKTLRISDRANRQTIYEQETTNQTAIPRFAASGGSAAVIAEK